MNIQRLSPQPISSEKIRGSRTDLKKIHSSPRIEQKGTVFAGFRNFSRCLHVCPTGNVRAEENTRAAFAGWLAPASHENARKFQKVGDGTASGQ